MDIERRVYNIDGLELREDETDEFAGKIVGHAAVFDTPTRICDFNEIVAPGAFEGHEDMDVRALINHDSGKVLGRNQAGTLELREDETGLLAIIDPPNTTYANDLRESIRRGDISQMSFGFRAVEEEWAEGDGDEPDTRTLKRVQLFDVSPVTFPAYPETDVAVRKHAEFRHASADAASHGGSMEQRGDTLAAALNRLINAKAGDDEAMRTEVIESMASAAGITPGTVNQILRGEINCPPLRRLQGFARALDVSVARLTTAAEGDGCDYDADRAIESLGRRVALLEARSL